MPVFYESGGVPVVREVTNQAAPLGGETGPVAVLDAGSKAMNCLRVAAAGQDAETVTIGSNVYELDTEVVAGITAGRIRVDLSGGATVKAQGTLTSADTGAFTAGKIVTIGTKVYTFRAAIDGTSVDGDVLAGANGDAGLTNLIAAINLGTGSGSLYAAAMTANSAKVSAGAIIAHAVIVTAKRGGTAGNSVVSTTDEAKLSWDAATLGTTTAGVDPTAENVTDGMVAAINANESAFVATKISANETLVSAVAVGVNTAATTETLAGVNNAWLAATMAGGAAPKQLKMAYLERVPTAQEVLLDHMFFAVDFTIAFIAVINVRVTATGIPKAWVGGSSITNSGADHRAKITNEGAVDYAETDTVSVLLIGT